MAGKKKGCWHSVVPACGVKAQGSIHYYFYYSINWDKINNNFTFLQDFHPTDMPAAAAQDAFHFCPSLLRSCCQLVC
jgi:hypothetical protein